MTSDSILIAMLIAAGILICPTGSYSTDIIHKTGRHLSGETLRSDKSQLPSITQLPNDATEFILTKSGRIEPETTPAEASENPISGDIDRSMITGSIEPEIGFSLNEDHADHVVSDSSVAKCGPSPLGPIEIKALVSQTAKREGVDELFALAIVEAESQNDRLRNSPRGARGPMQLLGETAARYGVKNICDPADNIAGGISYLKDLTEQFRNPMLVAAAYNAGEQSIYRYEGIPPFRETVTYVAKVMNLTMGITLPKHSHDRNNEADALSPPPSTQEPVAGVIQAPKRRGFVAGVMQF